jgi:hypothetical protein
MVRGHSPDGRDVPANDYFDLDGVSPCHSGPEDEVQAKADGDATNCPFSNVKFDNEYEGDGIVTIDFFTPSSVKCVGTATQGGLGVGYLGACGDGYGGGLIDGGLDIEVTTFSCLGGSQTMLVNRYWTDENDQPAYVESGGNPGKPLYLSASGSGTCWGEN